jgi:hypothetical protein
LQIDWLSLDMGGVRPTQGKTLALMQVLMVHKAVKRSSRCVFWDAGCGW